MDSVTYSRGIRYVSIKRRLQIIIDAAKAYQVACIIGLLIEKKQAIQAQKDNQSIIGNSISLTYNHLQIFFIGLIDFLMLTRSKIMMEESIRHTQNELPYFNTEYHPTPILTYNQSITNNSPSLHSPLSPASQGRQQAHSRNQILKELRQQYQNLRNLPIEDSLTGYGRGYDQDRPKLSQSSLSSSLRSRRSDGLGKNEPHQSAKVIPRELQALHLEKKQLQIAIGNSMRIIEELLNNEILLKKTIHELKSQNQGKGGIHQQYEMKMKSILQEKNEVQEQLNSALHENEKKTQRIKDHAQRVEQLEGEVVGKDREIKHAFDQQRRLHESIRNEKDKYLNLEIHCKAYKMEIDLLEKEKTSQVNRLLRQFESKESGNEKQMAYLIRKLQEEIKEKDKRCKQLIIERQQLRRQKQREQTQPVTRLDKNLQLMYKSREINQNNSKALTDSMNIIVAKMAEIEKKNDETIKREMQGLREKSEDIKRNSSEVGRVTELQKVIERQAIDKTRWTQEVSLLRNQIYDLQGKAIQWQKKWKISQQKEIELKEQIQELLHLNKHFSNTYNDHKTLKQDSVSFSSNIKSLQAEIDGHRQYLSNLTLSFKQKQKKYEDEIRVLKRKLNEAQFQTQKAKKQAELNLSVIRADHEQQAKLIVDQNAKLSKKLKELQDTTVLNRSAGESQVKLKENEIIALKNTIDLLKNENEKDLLVQKQFYDSKMIATENRYQAQLRAFSQKFITVTTANQKLLSQISTFSSKDTELIELRKLVKQSTAMNIGISHLWEIKEAEYGNINQLLGPLRVI